MPVDPNFNSVDRDKRLSDAIRLLNKIESSVKALELIFTRIPGDYPINTLLGVKLNEGKVTPYTIAEVKTLLGI